jgi:hypothetical protein
MDLTLHVWRQASRDAKGRFVEYKATGITAARESAAPAA